MSNKAQNTVKFFNDAKRFGFIKPNNGDKDVFVHISQLHHVGGISQDGQEVCFVSSQEKKSLEAKEVKLV